MECTAAIGMDELVGEEEETVYAAEGTAAHAWAELKARHQILKTLTDAQYQAEYIKWAEEWGHFVETDDAWTEMDRHTQAYVDLLLEYLAEEPGSVLLLERRLDAGVPGVWGTSDAIIVSPRRVRVVDFKYGAGVRVYAEDNKQTRLYACGALDEFGDVIDTTEDVAITIHQPRMGNVDTEVLTAEELRSWRAEHAIPRAEEALGPNPVFRPSDTACRWCPASGQCKAQLEWIFAEGDETSDPRLLSNQEMADMQKRLKAITQWVNAFEIAILDRAYSQKQTIPGYKVVRSGGQRRITDQEGAVKVLREKGHKDDEILAPRKIRGIGELETLLGKEEFASLLEPFITKGEGKPSIAPEDDSREAIDPNSEAKKEFSE